MYLKMHCAECSMCVAIDQLNRISSMQFTKFFDLIFSIDLRYGFWNKLKICAKKNVESDGVYFIVIGFNAKINVNAIAFDAFVSFDWIAHL